MIRLSAHAATLLATHAIFINVFIIGKVHGAVAATATSASGNARGGRTGRHSLSHARDNGNGSVYHARGHVHHKTASGSHARTDALQDIGTNGKPGIPCRRANAGGGSALRIALMDIMANTH